MTRTSNMSDCINYGSKWSEGDFTVFVYQYYTQPIQNHSRLRSSSSVKKIIIVIVITGRILDTKCIQYIKAAIFPLNFEAVTKYKILQQFIPRSN